LFLCEEYERAKELFLEAIGVEADCVEAIYNLGLVNKSIERYHEALQAFEKLNSILPKHPDVLYQLGDLCHRIGHPSKAVEWFSLLVSPKTRPTDPEILARLGQLFASMDDEAQAYHYYMEAYRYWPTNLDVIAYLGVHFVKQEAYENAIQFFERAAQIEGGNSRWRLMVASCYRRMGHNEQALKIYEDIHRESPDDIECLRYLLTLLRDLGLDHEEYAVKLRKLERMQQEGGTAAAPPTHAEPAPAPLSRHTDSSLRDSTERGVAYGREESTMSGQQGVDPRPLYEEEGPVPQDRPGGRRLQASNRAEDDDWGDDELGDDLLPL